MRDCVHTCKSTYVLACVRVCICSCVLSCARVPVSGSACVRVRECVRAYFRVRLSVCA